MDHADHGFVGAEYSAAKRLEEVVGHLAGGLVDDVFVAMLKPYIYKAIEGGIIELLALGELLVIHAQVVVFHHVTNQVVVGPFGLEYHHALFGSSACTTCHLAHHLEGPLMASEVGATEHGVGVEDSHHVYSVEVQAFANHLSTNEYVGSAL